MALIKEMCCPQEEYIRACARCCDSSDEPVPVSPIAVPYVPCDRVCIAEPLPSTGSLSEGRFCFPALSLFVFFCYDFRTKNKKVPGCVAMATPDEALLDCGSVSRSKPPCKQRMLAAC